MSKAVINIVLFSFLGLLLFVGLCSRNAGKNTEYKKLDTVFYLDTNIVYDTVKVYDTHIFKLNVSVPIYKIIDIDNDIAVYSDSLTDSNITIMYSDTVQGRILGKALSYKLHIPIEITKTIEVTKTQTIKQELNYHKIYGSISLGNYDKRIGIVYSPKRSNWAFGYDYNLHNNSHNATINYRICKF